MSLQLRRLAPYGYALAGVALITALIGLVRSQYAVPDLSMVYLVLVLWLGARYGILPAALAGVAALLAYDFFFVPPPGTLAVRGPNELLGLVLLLAAALVTGQLAASLRYASARSAATAEEATALYELATGALRLPEVNSALSLLCERARALTSVERFSLIAIEDGVARVAGGDELSADVLRKSEWSFQHGTAVGGSIGPQGLNLVRLAGGSPEPVILPLAGGVAVLTIAADPDERQRRLLAALLSLGSLLLDRRAAAFQAQRASTLEASDSLKAAVLSSLSHELKSPLAALRAGLTALAGPGTGLDAEHVELVRGLDREATRLDRLVGELLTMSRLESGQDLMLEARSYPEIAGAVLERMAHQLADRRLVVRLPDDLPAVQIDELQVDRLLTNLVDNAIDFTPPGGKIEVGARAEGGQLIAWVENEGPMIPAADLQSIFDKFWTGRGSGTGLGLAIARLIVERHGGTIEVRNRRTGPRFQFTLPLAVAVTRT
ncbi:MAG TPA: ATP-binding protein [Candidatus Dormibacteraeota bacterium]|jgi:two-component system sensor histidine kinase KdpD